MAIVSLANDTQVAVVGTEHTLSTQTGVGTYVLTVDTGNMVNGDVVELRIKTKVRATGNTQLAYIAVYSHAQGSLNKYSVPVPLPTGREIIFTLKQTAPAGGTADAAVSTATGPPGTLTDTRTAWPVNSLTGRVVTCNGKTMTVASNTATVLTGTDAWSGGGNPGNGYAYSFAGKNFPWEVLTL